MGGAKRAAAAPVVPEAPNAPPPLSSPPALEQARMYTHHASPPDSPPALAQATLPATAHLADGSSSRSSSSPEQQYAQYVIGNSQYSYRSGTTTYQEQSQGSGFTYVHTTPLNANSSTNPLSYPSSSHDTFNNSHPSRHSISHITATTSPPSPASDQSASSHTSGPPTPTYNIYDDAQARYHTNPMMPEQGHHLYASSARFDSPPPTLAPIQERRDDCSSSPYIHHYPHAAQYPPLSMWKSESGLRKGVV
jgi:zinc finger protein CreA/MIG